MVLFLHHRYRILGGEERMVDDLARLVRTELGEPAEVLERDSRRVSSARAAAGLLAGGLHPVTVARAVESTGARIVHAHNLQPTLGWRALAAARAAGARVVLHLHQYRLVCAVGVCFRDGHECTECHGRGTTPGIRHNCRGSRGEALAYGASLALHQRRMLDHADALIVPSAFARDRLVALGIAEATDAHIVGGVVRNWPTIDPDRPRAGALVVSRLSVEKGVDVAIAACADAGVPLTIAGDGPQRAELEAHVARLGADVRFLGHVDDATLGALRADAAIAVVPSRSAETFGLAAAEAMAAGLPVAASRVGALPELVPAEWLAAPDDASALSRVITTLTVQRRQASVTARQRARELVSPTTVGRALRSAYVEALAGRSPSDD